MRKAYYHRKLAFLEPSYSIMPYSVSGRAVESAIARMLFAQTGTTALERYKRYQKQGIKHSRKFGMLMSLAGICVIITAMMDMVAINSQDAYLSADTMPKRG